MQNFYMPWPMLYSCKSHQGISCFPVAEDVRWYDEVAVCSGLLQKTRKNICHQYFSFSCRCTWLISLSLSLSSCYILLPYVQTSGSCFIILCWLLRSSHLPKERRKALKWVIKSHPGFSTILLRFICHFNPLHNLAFFPTQWKGLMNGKNYTSSSDSNMFLRCLRG